MTIDISPEAVERIITSFEKFMTDMGNKIDSVWEEISTLRALSAALTASQAETAAAYEAAALACKAQDNIFASDMYADDQPFSSVDERFACGECEIAIRALTPADSKAALDRMIAEARAESLSGPWDDKPDALTDAVEAAHPHHTKDFATYIEALELVSNRHSKGALVGLVNYLLAKNKATPKGKDHE